MKKILFLAAALLAIAALIGACTRDGVPSGEMTSAQLKQNPGAAQYMTLGNYSLFKTPMAYMGEEKDWPEAKNTYIRHFFPMSEFRGDNIAFCYGTVDEVFPALTYRDTELQRNNTYLWWVAYRIIYGANSVIESLQEGQSSAFDHLLGENYFLRAICHLHLVTLYAKPYSHGEGNPGVIIRKTTDTSTSERATVGAVYDQIVLDLQKAITLMSAGTSPLKGSAKAFASKAAAQGLLSRVYLHMGRNQDVIDLVDEMLAGAAPSTKLHNDPGTYYANALNSVETLWAIGQTPNDVGSTPTAKIAALYYKDEAGTGWGEVFWSDPLLDLINRYPQDKRLGLMVSRLPGNAAPDAKQIRYNVMNNDAIGQVALPITNNAVLDPATGKYYFMKDGARVTLETEINPANGYPQHYIMLDGVKTPARIAQSATPASYNAFPQYMVTKFSNQDGIGMLSSPPMIRWGEVILNRAEARAKTGNDSGAIEDVNVLRTRAGLSGDALFTTSNYTGRGYATVLDVVLDERRLELCFEGHRAIDQFRNNKPIDRQYAGFHTWEVIQPTDARFPYMIPADEIRVSGIPQNVR